MSHLISIFLFPLFLSSAHVVCADSNRQHFSFLSCFSGRVWLQHQVCVNVFHFRSFSDYTIVLVAPKNLDTSTMLQNSLSVTFLNVRWSIIVLRLKRSSLRSPARWLGKSVGVVKASSIVATSSSWMCWRASTCSCLHRVRRHYLRTRECVSLVIRAKPFTCYCVSSRQGRSWALTSLVVWWWRAIWVECLNASLAWMTKSWLTNRGKEELLMILGKGFRVPHACAKFLLVCLLSYLLWKLSFSFCPDFVSLIQNFLKCLIVKCVVYFDFFVASLFLCATTVS